MESGRRGIWTRLQKLKRRERAQIAMRGGEQSVTEKPCTCLPQKPVESVTTLHGGRWVRSVLGEQDLVLGEQFQRRC